MRDLLKLIEEGKLGFYDKGLMGNKFIPIVIREDVELEKLFTIAPKNESLELRVSKVLHKLGMSTNIKGYRYVRTAITMVYEDSSLLGLVTKRLYPNIAEQYGTTPSRVERAIRHAIETTWNKGVMSVINELFSNTVSYHKTKPTNSEFIAMFNDKLKLNEI